MFLFEGLYNVRQSFLPIPLLAPEIIHFKTIFAVFDYYW